MTFTPEKKQKNKKQNEGFRVFGCHKEDRFILMKTNTESTWCLEWSLAMATLCNLPKWLQTRLLVLHQVPGGVNAAMD